MVEFFTWMTTSPLFPGSVAEIITHKLYAGFRLVPAGANRQPAFAAYSRTVANAPWSAHSIQVLSLEEDRIATLTLFAKPEGPRLFHQFGLPLILPDAAAAGSSKATSGS